MIWMTLAMAQTTAEVYSVGFRAVPGGQCDDRAASRKGVCLDRAELLDLERAWGVRPARAEDREAWIAVSRLQARTWEDLARRWALPDVEGTLVAEGITALPAPTQIWQQSSVSRGAYSLPRRERWLGPGVWFDPFATPTSERSTGALFNHVRYHGPEGQESLPRLVRLSGRFANKLGYDGKRHDFDIMDGDPASSGPFFEQMFPYQRKLSAVREAENTVYSARERIPLTDFRFPRHLHDSTDDPFAAIRAFEAAFADVTVAGGLEGASQLATQQFTRFQRVVSVAAAQYAMQDITRNQMRVLAALTAMRHGPEESGSEGYARDLVAAARGETDTSEEILEQLDSEAQAGLPTSQHIRYERLPAPIVEPWVLELTPEVSQDEGFYAGLNADLQAVFPNILRPERPDLSALDRTTRREWLRQSVLPGNDREDVDAEVLRIALSRMLEQLPKQRRDRVETWMLMDHALGAMATTFDDSRPSTPAEVVEGATAQWQVVLAQHGHVTQQLPQGLGAVDPTAICSTADGLEGRDQASFKRVTVDVLVAGPQGADVNSLLEHAGPALPFHFIDDPAHNTPELERLVGLGGGEDLYRLRWAVWSGWHLMWDLAPASDDRSRLVLRTGAVCEDLVLTSPGLAPTLIRAGLLNANFRPTRPEQGKLAVKAEQPSGEDAVGAVQGGPAAAEAMAGKIDEVKNIDVSAQLEGLAGKKPSVGASEYKVELEDLRPEVQLVRDLIWAPIGKIFAGKPGLLFVADIGEPGSSHRIGTLKARTPYAALHGSTPKRKASDPEHAGRFVGSGWLWLHKPEGRPVQVAPAFAAKDTEERAPKWTRRTTADFGVTVGAGAFPWRTVQYVCAEVDPGTTSSCRGPGAITTEGFSVDMQGLGTLWRHGRTMFGIDVGLEARLDVRHAGPSWLWKHQNATDFNFTIRPAAGLVTGVRIAPRPGRLFARRSAASTWGTPRNDGPIRLGRWQHGLKGGVLIGPGFNGMEATVAAEAWTARSMRRSRGKKASFTPYHPGTLLGPYARGHVGLPLTDGTEANRFLNLKRSWTVLVGLRWHQRLAEPSPKPPEVE